MDFGSMDDSLSQELVEGVRVQLNPAPLVRRIAALVIDYGIVSTLAYAVVILALVLFAGVVGVGLALTSLSEKLGLAGTVGLIIMALLVLLAVMAITHLYFIMFEFKKGQTLGKKVFGLKVVSLNGSRLTFKQCTLREVMRYIDGFLLLPGLISVLVTDRKQRLGDLLSDTLVVWSKNEEEAGGFLYVKKKT
jgi:uncharacterized RDD family membrane protein YckC